MKKGDIKMIEQAGPLTYPSHLYDYEFAAKSRIFGLIVNIRRDTIFDPCEIYFYYRGRIYKDYGGYSFP